MNWSLPTNPKKDEIMQKEINKEALEIEKIRAEISKLIAETGKINRESIWHPILVASALIGSVAAIVKLFF